MCPLAASMNNLFGTIRARVLLSLVLGSACLSPHVGRATTLTVGISDLGALLSAAPNGQPDGVLGNILAEIARQEGWILKTELCT